ncbi:MAG: sulfotransferase [Magnetovibrionaceae bacterium]
MVNQPDPWLPTSPRPPILITGLPRSGTSLVTGLLGTAGLWLGRTVPGGSENPTGFFEHEALREQVQKRILKRLGGDAGGVRRLPRLDSLPELPALKSHVEDLLAKDGWTPDRRWGFKDAKLSLTWPIWHRAFPEALWVIVRRPRAAVIQSCLRTSFMKEHSTDPAFWDSFVDAYLKRLEALKRSDARWVEVFADDAAEGRFAALEDIARRAGLSWDEQAARSLLRPDAYSAQSEAAA